MKEAAGLCNKRYCTKCEDHNFLSKLSYFIQKQNEISPVLGNILEILPCYKLLPQVASRHFFPLDYSL